ncbi:DUF2550 domain-containing protein [Oerskovia sp. KBS0722]|uniref:DUF2550 domain-containing protein n=1 Tax=Oerskovia sp. KBS0722 TaxID=1179673 RepID=UPI00110E12EA|nr:DUF2550 domain-containing protein [Oerskovia sp. KBS0722]QDW64081.1 DUF2550 family protein [Oerskovia sp. KBS0722]
MPLPAWIAIGLLLAVALVVGLGALRLRAISHRVGSFECSARPAGDEQASWSLGIAHYGVGRIDWWRCWSLSLRPSRSWRRQDLVIVSRRPLDGDRDLFLVECSYEDVRFELTMSSGAYAGLASWLEAAPPGRRGVVV